MSKLQEVNRKDESKVYKLYIPNHLITAVEWKKGERLICREGPNKSIIISKET